jgi:hypothetical protein
LKENKKLYNDIKIKETPPIKIPELNDMTGINYFKVKSGVVLKKEVICKENDEEKRQNFKKLIRSEQLKMLFNYMKSKKEGCLYKKEGNRVIGEWFGVGKDLIGRLLKELESKEYICKLNELDKFYKILKEEF